MPTGNFPRHLKLDSFLFVGVPVGAQKPTDELDRGIERVARSDRSLDFVTVGLGTVFGLVAQVGDLVVREKRFLIVGNSVNHGMPDTLGHQAALHQMDQIVKTQPGGQVSPIGGFREAGIDAQAGRFDTELVEIQLGEVFDEAF